MQRNVELLEKVMQHITDHPEQHDQTLWVNECGTIACFAGRAAILSGMNAEQIYESFRARLGAWETGARILGITIDEAYTLFSLENTVPMLELMVKDLINGDQLRGNEECRNELYG